MSSTPDAHSADAHGLPLELQLAPLAAAEQLGGSLEGVLPAPREVTVQGDGQLGIVDFGLAPIKLRFGHAEQCYPRRHRNTPLRRTCPAPFTSALAAGLAPDLLARFQRYVRIDTQSRRERERSPSTPGQLELGRLLVDELNEAGLSDAALDENGYVTATLAGHGAPGSGPAIGLIAHLDTSPDAPGSGRRADRPPRTTTAA